MNTISRIPVFSPVLGDGFSGIGTGIPSTEMLRFAMVAAPVGWTAPLTQVACTWDCSTSALMATTPAMDRLMSLMPAVVSTRFCASELPVLAESTPAFNEIKLLVAAPMSAASIFPETLNAGGALCSPVSTSGISSPRSTNETPAFTSSA
ncbi:hypothetical protein [Delftia acidovorans]|uniref:hypothetical protein n=1 Tax=Delftia acidovorans TaxID=80866 RepID=UPI00241D6B19|nr:hypothetical protein [Delftia acidovorans]